jgi:hypothetical protein
MARKFTEVAAVVVLALAGASLWGNAAGTQTSGKVWRFAVSGDSRNCGDVVMPTIAASALRRHISFYWHLGDLRAIFKIDEDMQHEPEHVAIPLTIDQYERIAWDDFIQNQIAPFGSTPFFLGIGNHETILPKARAEYAKKFADWLDPLEFQELRRKEFVAQFADWLNALPIKKQRELDDPRDHLVRTYYHWVENNVDFIYLDNASKDQFDAAQLRWVEGVIQSAEKDPRITTLVVGTHRALPESISYSHSMNESAQGTESGRRVYADLLHAQNEARKHVYVLASHSHFYMENIYNTEYWRSHGGVLPGWIVGTAGAVRYALPEKAGDARAAKTDVYGYLLGSVSPNGEIHFEFRQLSESDVPAAVASRFTPNFVHWCWAENSQAH